MASKTTTRQFITKARIIHGDRYDYSLVTYINSSTPVSIVCAVHGIFQQTPATHLYKKCGCKSCGYEKNVNQMKKTTLDFITDARRVHGSTYSYDNTQYVNTHTFVDITCPTHGIFSQRPNAHIHSKHGCPKCARVKRIEYHQQTTAEVITKANIVHNNKYNYSKIGFTQVMNNITIICPHHGEFIQSANNHINLRSGCPKCARIAIAENMSITAEQFILSAHQKYKNKFDYSNIHYTGYQQVIDMICPIHGVFRQSPMNHMYSSHGCQRCGIDAMTGYYSDTLFDQNPAMMLIPASLYFVRLFDDNETFLKIGITTKSIVARFKGTGYTVDVLTEVTGKLYDMFLLEQSILSNPHYQKYYPIRLKGGRTECFVDSDTQKQQILKFFNS